MKKFVILTTQRTGSTLLWRYLDQHPEIEAHGELFLKSLRRPDSYSTFINRTKLGFVKNYLSNKKMLENYFMELSPANDGVKAYGFKLMYNQRSPRLEEYIKNNDFYIVHLIRKNFLKIVLSRETASKRGLYHASHEDKVESTKITLDGKKLIDDLTSIKNEVDLNSTIFKELPYQEVFYEDLISNKGAVTSSLIKFLGLSNEGISDMEFPLKKINSDSLSDHINNFEEIKDYIQNSEFNNFLE